MEQKNQPNEKSQAQRRVPQMQIRSDVRSGGDLETCQFNLDKWRDRYYYWYNVARNAGKI